MGVDGQIRSQLQKNFGHLPEDQIEQMVQFEVAGIAASEHVGSGWCTCTTVEDDSTTYYCKPVSGYHGWFHDPSKGGCGGITQTG